MTSTEIHIKNAFLDLYRDNYFNKITVKDVCQKANISRATFYVYYEDLESLLHEIENEILDYISSVFGMWKYVSLDKVEYSQPFPMFLDILNYVYKNIKAYRALLGYYGNNSFITKYNRLVKKSCYNKWIEEGYHEDDAEVLACLSAGAIINICTTWVLNGFSKNKDVSPERIAILTTNAIASLRRMKLNK